MSVPDHIGKPDYWQFGLPHSEMAERGNSNIRVYSPRQIEGIRAACRVGREVLDIAGGLIMMMMMMMMMMMRLLVMVIRMRLMMMMMMRRRRRRRLRLRTRRRMDLSLGAQLSRLP
jgi:hypothetical protein